jgi:hypothetical protein
VYIESQCKTNEIKMITTMMMNRDGSLSTVTNSGLNDRGSNPGWSKNVFLHRHVQIGSEIHTAFYPTGAAGTFPGGKADGARNWPLTFI